MNTNDPGREPTDAELERRFEQWWADEGSGMAPRDLEEHYSHAERVSRIAWMNGAFLASGARPMPKSRNRPPLTDLDLSAIKRMVLAAKAWYAPELGEECEHGHLARKCETCQLIAAEARVAELEAALSALMDEYDDRKAQFGNDYLWKKHEDAELVNRARAVANTIPGKEAPDAE